MLANSMFLVRTFAFIEIVLVDFRNMRNVRQECSFNKEVEDVKMG